MKKDYKLKKLFALFLAVAGILGIAMVGNAQDEAGKIFVKKTATKIYDATAKDNLEKGRFAKVSLSVNANPYNASVTTNGELDIVLIFDSSNSMNASSGALGETRMQAAKKAATNFANTLMDDKGTVKIGIVEFGTRVLDVQEMTTEKETVKKFIKNKLDLPEKYNDGGTNLQAAIERADTVLNNGKREDAKQIVIVLTDGIPTYFTYNNNIYGTGQNDAEVAYNCNGYYCDWQRPSDAALKAMNKLKRNHSTSDVYTILFGNDTSATATLKKINPEQTKPLYKNYNALTGEDLKKMFETLSSQLMNIIGKDSVVTDIIPKEFMLTETSKNKLIEQGVEVKENREDGTTELIWKIGNIEANKEISLTYEVKAKDEYHGSIFTNKNATLITKVEENNPYYKNQPSTQTIVFEKPTVEIPAITNSDHYKDNSSYIGYAENVINGTSILNNDLDKIIKNDKTKENDVVIVKDEIVINETENVTKVNGETNKYQIRKDGVLKGILTINKDGTFTFSATENASGEIEFTYHIKSTINSHHETEFVYSNDSTVTLLVKERQTKSITGEKIWKDNNNNDNSRPESITVKLFANGKEVESLKVTNETVAANNPNTWLYEFNNLYMYEVGHENEDNYLINYTVTEENVPGYTTKITGTTITNTHDPITIDIVGEKVWKDNNNNDNSRPESITVKLFANEKEVKSLKVTKETVAANNPNTWLYEFKDLPKYENGKEINYTVTEENVPGYTTKITGTTITNTHDPITIDIVGEKVWKDNNNNDNSRPESITVKLFANEKEVKSLKVTKETVAANNPNTWLYEFKDLPKYENGKEINYTVTEENVPGYTTKITGTTITNTHNPITIDIVGEKVWKDNNNNDNSRPESITVKLFANEKEVKSLKVTKETVAANNPNTWLYEFKDLPKYENGKEINYTVTEENVPGYTTKITGTTITNTHDPITIDIVGEKVWKDNNNNDNSRPESITVKLFANEKEVKSLKVTKETVAANNPNTWLYEFKDLPKYENGKEINYTVTEENVPGYTTKITGTTITNTHNPITIDIVGEKVWKDNNNNDNSRPESITVKLFANEKEVKSLKVTKETVAANNPNTWLYEFKDLPKYENGKEINYTVTEENVPGYTTKITGTTITNTHNPITIDIVGEKVWLDNNNNDNSRPESITVKLFANEKEVKSLKVTKETVATNNPNTWLYEFKDLPKYENGKEINYTVKEEKVNNYETSYNKNNKFIIINTHENEQIKLSGTKTWNDKNNQDGIRPTSIEVTLIGRVGEKTVYTSEKKEVSADTNWTYEFEKLDKFYEGKKIVYSVIEENVKGYSVKYNGLDIINTHIPEVISITGEKVWVDGDNQDGIRPEEITVILNKTVAGTTTKVTEKIVEEDETGNWTFTFENLPKYENGQEICYTLEEVDVNGYTGKIKDYKITNTHAPETVTFNIVKEWYDYENNDGIRPNSITVRIKADHEEVATAILSEENNWNAIFENLPKYKNGIEINYEIVEDEVEGYTPTISNPIKENDNNVTVVIKNTHEKETTEIVIEKVWDDVGNENKRPDSITVNIYANGELFETVKITAENNWQLKLENLQKYFSGEEIIYTIEEVELEDYVTDYEGYTIINSYKAKGEITPPNTGIIMNTNSKNLYIETLTLLLGTISITYIFKKREN